MAPSATPRIVCINLKSDLDLQNGEITRASRARHGSAASLGRVDGCTRVVADGPEPRPRPQDPSVPPKLVQCTKDDVCPVLSHQICPMRGPGTVDLRCALAQTTVWHEPCDFQEDSMFRHTLVLASKTIRVVSSSISPDMIF